MRAELDALVADHKVRIGSILALKVASFFSPNFLTSLYNSPGWAQAYTTDMDDWADDVRVKALATVLALQHWKIHATSVAQPFG